MISSPSKRTMLEMFVPRNHFRAVNFTLVPYDILITIKLVWIVFIILYIFMYYLKFEIYRKTRRTNADNAFTIIVS